MSTPVAHSDAAPRPSPIGCILLGLASVCVLIPHRSPVWMLAIPFAVGGAALVPRASMPCWRVWLPAVALSAWFTWLWARAPIDRLTTALMACAVAGIWIAAWLSRPGELKAAGLVLGLVAVAAIGCMVVRLGVSGIRPLYLMEVWRAGDMGLLTPFMWPELAAGIGIMALPMLIREARSGSSRLCRTGARLLCLPLIAGLGLVGGPLGWLAAATGALWAAAAGRWMRWWGWVLVAVLACGLVGCVLWKLPDRGDPIRKRGLMWAQSAMDTRDHMWANLMMPHPSGDAPRLGHWWPTERVDHGVPTDAIERPRTALSDVALLTAELGPAGSLLVLLALVALIAGSRAAPGVAGAVAGGGMYAALVGHVAGPLNGALMLLLVLSLLAREMPRDTRRSARHGLAVAAMIAVLAPLALTLSPPAEPDLRETYAFVNWQQARARTDQGQLTAYRLAASAYMARWETLNRAPWAHPPERISETARQYASFCDDYAARLEDAGDPNAAAGYRALGRQLRRPGSLP